jgi:hypothetical protein
MAAVTTILAGASLALGVAGTVAQINQQKKAEAEAKRAAQKQETKAAEAAALKGKDQQDVRVKLGTDGKPLPGQGNSNAKGQATNRKTTTGVNDRRLFGTSGTSAARIGGL